MLEDKVENEIKIPVEESEWYQNTQLTCWDVIRIRVSNFFRRLLHGRA
jgi:hypothetical protein